VGNAASTESTQIKRRVVIHFQEYRFYTASHESRNTLLFDAVLYAKYGLVFDRRTPLTNRIMRRVHDNKRDSCVGRYGPPAINCPSDKPQTVIVTPVKARFSSSRLRLVWWQRASRVGSVSGHWRTARHVHDRDHRPRDRHPSAS
jgi:hypothetical protein